MPPFLEKLATLWCMGERRESPQMTPPSCPPSAVKVYAPHAHKRVVSVHKCPAKRSIHERLRAVMGDMITEEELEQRFTFGRVLGTGATSKVYEAVDTQTGATVAVKVFDKAAMVEARRCMVADGKYVPEKAVHRVRRRLLKLVSELEICKKLDHPNIIKFLGAYETSHRVCLVHELVEGSDLLEYLLAHGKMSEDEAAGVFRQLLEALEYCHEHHIFHRDLKLENVLISPDKQVKLIDFGLSEVVTHSNQRLKTVCGTPLYCSPEVLFLHSTPTAARDGFRGGPADVWSVGVLIFALLTGCAPFDDSDFQRLRRDVSRNRINFPVYISDEVKGLLKALLVADAQMRPTVKDLLGYRWLQDATTESTASASNASTNEAPDDSEQQCTRSSSVDIDPRCRSLSCRTESATEGTCSSSTSLEDASDKPKRTLSSPTPYGSSPESETTDESDQ